MSEPSKSDPTKGMVKIVFFSEGKSESMWAEPVGPDTYKLQNTPWDIYGVNCDDIVRAQRAADGMLEFVEVVTPSGSSTFRIMRRDGVAKAKFMEALAPLLAWGCSYEQSFVRLYALNVPPDAGLNQVTEVLENGSTAGIWDWEAGSLDANGNPREGFAVEDRPDQNTIGHRLRELKCTVLRVTFRLKQDQDGYPPYLFESLHAAPLEDGTYEVANIPFFSYDAALGDVVKASEDPDEDGLFFVETVRESGNSVVRVKLSSKAELTRLADQLLGMGCESEALHTWLAVNIPAGVSYAPILELLREGEESGRWGFEEAVLCHTVAPGEIETWPVLRSEK